MNRLVEMLKETFSRWSGHEAPRLGAALTFYTILSLSPLLVLAVGIAALVFGSEAARQTVMEQAQSLIGAEGARTVGTAMQNARQPGAASIAGLISLVVLLFGASGVFMELRSALNKIWDVSPAQTSGVWAWVRDRFFSIGMVLALGFLLLVLLVVSTALSVLASAAQTLIPLPGPLMYGISVLVGVAGVAGVFALIFHYVPQIDIEWKHVWPGALFAALLFEIGRFAIGIYLGSAAVGSAYGAAGSLVVVIVWLYYASQIFYFGAEFTRVWAERHGWQPERAASEEEAAEEPVAPPARVPRPQPHAQPRRPAPLAYPGPQPAPSRVLAFGALAALALRALRRR